MLKLFVVVGLWFLPLGAFAEKYGAEWTFTVDEVELVCTWFAGNSVAVFVKIDLGDFALNRVAKGKLIC